MQNYLQEVARISPSSTLRLFSKMGQFCQTLIDYASCANPDLVFTQPFGRTKFMQIYHRKCKGRRTEEDLSETSSSWTDLLSLRSVGAWRHMLRSSSIGDILPGCSTKSLVFLHTLKRKGKVPRMPLNVYNTCLCIH